MLPGTRPLMFHVPPVNPEQSRYPLLFGGQGLLSTPDALRLMHEGKVAVSIVQGANPVATQPQPDVTSAAFRNVGFLCVVDPYMGETARLADLVLPAATYLERTEPEWFKSDSWYPELTLRQKCVQVGEAQPDTQIMIELGRALGLFEEFPPEDIAYYIDDDLRPSRHHATSSCASSPHGRGATARPGRARVRAGRVSASPGGVGERVVCGARRRTGSILLPNWEESSESARSSKPELAAGVPLRGVHRTGRVACTCTSSGAPFPGWARCSHAGRAMVNTARAPRSWALKRRRLGRASARRAAPS